MQGAGELFVARHLLSSANFVYPQYRYLFPWLPYGAIIDNHSSKLDLISLS